MATPPEIWLAARGSTRFVKRGNVSASDLQGADFSDIRLEMVDASRTNMSQTRGVNTCTLRDLERPRHKFAILKSPPRFIQTMINPDGSFVVDFSEGSVKKMFEFEPATLEHVEKVFLLFLDDGEFRNALPFRPIANR